MIFELTMIWHKIAASKAEVFSGIDYNILELEVDGKKICLVKYQDRLYGCSAKCPHAGGKMAMGYTDLLGNIVCPLHRYKFNIKNGRNTSGEGYYLKTYPVEEREEGICVGI